jgi:putative glutamine amidotransferase
VFHQEALMSLPVIGITGRVEQAARLPEIPVCALAQPYTHAVTLAGGAPVILPPHMDEAQSLRVIERLDGLILSGGGDVKPALYGERDSSCSVGVDERRDRTELLLARQALEHGLALLAICRGIQVLNVAAGGTLIQDIPSQVPEALDSHGAVTGRPLPTIAHTVEVAADSRLARLVGAGELDVNSAHHQAIRELGAGLHVTARAPDGIIEGVERPDHPFCVGVQWHPEVMVDDHPNMRRLFKGLIAHSRAR